MYPRRLLALRGGQPSFFFGLVGGLEDEGWEEATGGSGGRYRARWDETFINRCVPSHTATAVCERRTNACIKNW
jgi:hypothetical protein